MLIFAHIANQLSGIKEFVVPSYHPERHYMRGPGPACARLVRAAHPETAELRRS